MFLIYGHTLILFLYCCQHFHHFLHHCKVTTQSICIFVIFNMYTKITKEIFTITIQVQTTFTLHECILIETIYILCKMIRVITTSFGHKPTNLQINLASEKNSTSLRASSPEETSTKGALLMRII